MLQSIKLNTKSFISNYSFALNRSRRLDKWILRKRKFYVIPHSFHVSWLEMIKSDNNSLSMSDLIINISIAMYLCFYVQHYSQLKRINLQVIKIKLLLILMNMLRYRHDYMPRKAVIKLQITHLLLLLYSQISVIWWYSQDKIS